MSLLNTTIRILTVALAVLGKGNRVPVLQNSNDNPHDIQPPYDRIWLAAGGIDVNSQPDQPPPMEEVAACKDAGMSCLAISPVTADALEQLYGKIGPKTEIYLHGHGYGDGQEGFHTGHHRIYLLTENGTIVSKRTSDILETLGDISLGQPFMVRARTCYGGLLITDGDKLPKGSLIGAHGGDAVTYGKYAEDTTLDIRGDHHTNFFRKVLHYCEFKEVLVVRRFNSEVQQ